MSGERIISRTGREFSPFRGGEFKVEHGRKPERPAWLGDDDTVRLVETFGNAGVHVRTRSAAEADATGLWAVTDHFWLRQDHPFFAEELRA